MSCLDVFDKINWLEVTHIIGIKMSQSLEWQCQITLKMHMQTYLDNYSDLMNRGMEEPDSRFSVLSPPQQDLLSSGQNYVQMNHLHWMCFLLHGRYL